MGLISLGGLKLSFSDFVLLLRRPERRNERRTKLVKLPKLCVLCSLGWSIIMLSIGLILFFIIFLLIL